MNRPDDARSLLSFYRFVYAAGSAVSILAVALGLWAGANRSSPLILAGTAAVFGLLLVIVTRRLREFRSRRHLPGPKPSFFLGNLGDLLAHGHGGRHEALHALHATYGPVVRLHLPWGTAPLVSLSYVSPNLHRKELDSLRRADGTVLSRSLMGMAGGSLHRSHRRVLSPALTTRSVTQRSDVLKGVSIRYVEKWKGAGERYDGLQADLRDWSVNCLSEFLCGEDWEEPADLPRYHRALAAVEEEVSFRAFHPFFVRWIFPRRRRRVRAAYREVAAVLGAALHRRALRVPAGCPAHGRPDDPLDRVSRAPWSAKDRVEEMMSLVLGGADPMSYVLSQALVMLSLDPHVQEKARKSAAAGEDAQPYIRSIVHETLRLFPPVPFSAKFSTERAVEEHGMSIPPGTSIMWMKNEVGRNPDVFHEADRFDPDRFDAGSDTLNSFLPFGAGPRHCVGNRLAEQQCAVLIAAILKNFDIVPVENVQVHFHSTISVVPSAVPVRLVVR
ncbi:cytochrome P450 [Streptomyces sp. BR123]|uniref:cytochrome P450 n=1 Tax=Streptomyces sp. BR123 TaxID=2749828 RepID=UPI0015C4804A|nr:cytochrome P450 [Streptomyces sp. BR123]NXY94799.1 cytochrome P450 [Streptomyces sp. BR123]